MKYMLGYHHQNLTDGELPLWRHGRGWWRAWHWEWVIFYRWPSPALVIRTGGYDDDNITAHVSLGFFSFYLGREFSRCFDDRELSVAWHDGCLWIKLWCDGDWHRDRPWYRNTICLHIVDWIIGKPQYECIKEESFEVFVPMPEGCYRAVATPETATWSRRFGIKTTRKSVDLRIDGGIPFAGKGENSWDCGDDGLWGIGGDTVERAIGNAVASVLANRKRHDYDSCDTGRVPANIVFRNEV